MKGVSKIKFYKYQCTGNDFIMIDDRGEYFDPGDHQKINKLCHRRFGIGADGLILLRNHPNFDFDMLYFNSDGKSASLCGNGSRCAVHFANYLGVIDKKTKFQTSEGPLEAFLKSGLIHLKMPDVVEVLSKGSDLFMDTGSPHHVCFINDNLAKLDVFEKGREIRYNEEYKSIGTNVNFVETMDKSELFVRTYERGVENETLSCGTGVTASVLASGLKGMTSPVKVKTLGGELMISFKKTGPQKFENIYLIGQAEKVFEGLMTL